MKPIRFWKEKGKTGMNSVDVPEDEINVNSGVKNGNTIATTALWSGA
jgi:hypothetical protein